MKETMFSPCFLRFHYVSTCLPMFSLCYHQVYVVFMLFPPCLPKVILVSTVFTLVYLRFSRLVVIYQFLKKSEK